MEVNHIGGIRANGGYHGTILWWNDTFTWSSGAPCWYIEEGTINFKTPKGGKQSYWLTPGMGFQISRCSTTIG